MRLYLNKIVFARVQDPANAHVPSRLISSILKKAGFEPREILIKLPQTARVSRFVVYRGHGLAVSVKDNYAVAQPESLDQTLCFPEQTPDFIEILKALKRCLVPENITLFIEQEKKGVLPAWYSTLSKKGFKTGKYGIGLTLSGKEIRIDCFLSFGMWVFSLDHIKSSSPASLERVSR